MSTLDAVRSRGSLGASAPVLVAVPASVLLGAVLAYVGMRVGPLACVGLVAAPALVLLTLVRPHLLVIGLALVLPFGALTLGPLEVVQFALALVVLGALAHAALNRSLVLPCWQVGVPLGAMLLSAALSTTSSRDPDVAFRLDILLLSDVLLVVTMVTVLVSARHVHQVAHALLVAGGAASAWALITSGHVTAYLDGAVVAGRASGGFAQPNELGLFTAALLVLAVGVGVATSRSWVRLLCAASGSLLLWALAMSLSRGAWIGAGVGLMSLAVLDPSSRRRLVRLAGPAVGVLVLMTVLGSSLVTSVATRLSSIPEASSNPHDQRTLIWAEAERQLGDRPLTGQGPGSFPAAAQSGTDGVGLEAAHAHHLLLTVAAEYGLVGLTALLALIAGLIYLGTGARLPHATQAASRRATLQPALVAALVAVFVHGLLDYPLRNATGSTAVWLLVGLLVAQHQVVDRAARPAPVAAAPVARERVA